MKNKVKSQFAFFAGTGAVKCCVLILLALGIMLTACEEPKSKEPKTWIVTLEFDSETGTANANPNPASKGKMVTVNATPGSKYKFKSWTVVTGGIELTDNYTSSAAFTMPGNAVTIKAEFEPLADVTLENVEYGYALPAKRSIGIASLGINTQTVSSIVMERGNESPFILDATDITNKITVGNVIAFFIQPQAGLKTGSHTDAVVITHGNGNKTALDILITVNPKPLTITGLGVANREYDGTTEATITGTAELAGLIEGDDVELSDGTATFEDHNAGTYIAVVFSDFIITGTDAHNYIFTQPQGITANILPRSVALRVTSPSSNNILIPFGVTPITYSGTTYHQNVTLGFSITGVLGEETVTVMVNDNNYGLSGESGSPGIIIVNYDGTQVEQTTSVQAELKVTGNYQLDADNSISVFDIRILDGLSTERWLPVLNVNITEFNNYALTANGLNRHYRLLGNITLEKPQAGASNWTAIGNGTVGFSGSFNGNNFEIQNLTINRQGNYQGLFGVVAEGGMVQNTFLVNTEITGSNYAGGLAGINKGTIQRSYVTGSVSGISNIGGLAGTNENTIQDCYTSCSVTGEQYVGGAAGVITGTNGIIRYCYTMGNIKGGSYIGGIAGYVYDNARLINCVALNNSVITSAANQGDIGRVAGAASQNLLANNYAWSTMIINKTIVETGINNTNGETTDSNSYRVATWWSGSLGWNGGPWNFTEVWQMNNRKLPKLGNTSGTQNHELMFGEVWIPAGSFTMGSPESESGRMRDEDSQRQVTLNGFYMCMIEVKQGQWPELTGSNHRSYAGNYNLPISNASWYEAIMFCNRMSIREGLTPAYSISGDTNAFSWVAPNSISNAEWDAVQIVAGSTGFRLPTEAQWEYACRAGTTTAYNTGNAISDNTGWYYDNSGEITYEAGKKPPNAWGLYDMHGNVSEWCWDWYTGNYNNAGGNNNPQGASSGTQRVMRGGNSYAIEEIIRSAARDKANPYYGISGFRVVRP